MRRLAPSTLQARLVLLILAIMLPLIILAVKNGLDERRLAEQRAQDQTRQALIQITNQQAQLIESAKQLLTVLAQVPSIQNQEKGACELLLSRLLIKGPQYTVIGLADTQGNPVCSAPPFREAVNLADRTYFQGALQTLDFSLGDYQIGRISGQPSINIGYPSRNAIAQVGGVLFAGISLEWIDESLDELELPENSLLIITDKNGTLLAHSQDPALIGQSAESLEIGRYLIDKPEPRSVVYTNDQGIERLFAVAPLQESSIGSSTYVAVGIPSNVIFEEPNRALMIDLVLLALITSLALAAAWFGTGGILVRPLHQLTGAAHQLAAGNFDTQLSGSTGEVGELASAFNEMAAQLRQSIGAIRERESTLAQNNAALQELLETVQSLELPAIPLQEGVLLTPLLGQMTEQRLATVTEGLLAIAYRERASWVIVDLSGLTSISTQILAHIQRLAQALRLLGTQVMLTGIQPEVAAAMAMLNAELPGIITAGTLADGVRIVLSTDPHDVADIERSF